MKTILFPTDFSMNSMHAIRYGLELFKDEKDMHYILLNAYIDPSAGAAMTYDLGDHMQIISQQMLDSLEEKLDDDYGYSDISFELLSVYGDLPGALKPIVKNKEVDLIVMGASGAGSPHISIFGSTAYACMKEATCPVLTIPLQTNIKSPELIGIASENKFKGDESFLSPILKIASIHNSWVMGVSVNTKESIDTKKNAKDVLEENMDIEFINLNTKDPVTGIEFAIGKYKLDLLAIIIKERPLLDRIFHKSVSKQIAKQIAIPILSLHS
ncbi:MAG: nucleotide-binding universal stress UspA family protein [Parvicellaceae bacterium]|jgi:nucleotide-binding universal stress UspA family protein